MVVYCKCKEEVTNTARYKAIKDTWNKATGGITVQCSVCGRKSPYKNIDEVHSVQLGFI